MNSKLLLLLTFTALLAICIGGPNPKPKKAKSHSHITKPQHIKDKAKHDKKVIKKEEKKTKVDEFEKAIKHAIDTASKSHHKPNDLAEIAIKTAMELEGKEIKTNKKTHPKANVLAEMLKASATKAVKLVKGFDANDKAHIVSLVKKVAEHDHEMLKGLKVDWAHLDKSKETKKAETKPKKDAKKAKKAEKKTNKIQFKKAIEDAIKEAQKISHHKPDDLAEAAIKKAMELEAKEIKASKQKHPQPNILIGKIKASATKAVKLVHGFNAKDQAHIASLLKKVAEHDHEMLKGLGVDLANIGKTKKEKKAEAKAKKEAKKKEHEDKTKAEKEGKKVTDLPKENSGGKLNNIKEKQPQPEPMGEPRVVNESFDSSLGKVEDQGMEQEDDAINSTSDNAEDPEPIANDDAGIESRLEPQSPEQTSIDGDENLAGSNNQEEEQQDTNMSDADSGVESDGVQPPAAADEDEDKELAESNGMDGDGEGLNNQVEQSEPVETGEQEEGKEDEPQLDDDNADVTQPKPENQD